MKVLDSSPLIAFLGQLNNPKLLSEFVQLGYTLIVPQSVYDEVKGEPERKNMEDMLADGLLRRLDRFSEEELADFRNRYPRLGRGESELILWGVRFNEQKKKCCCIIDDAVARRTAEELGLKCKGTIGLLIKLRDAGVINEMTTQEHFKRLRACGFRYKFELIRGQHDN